MERYIAVDNVCAWPNLTRMPDGDIIATIFNQPCHGRWAGDVECWASSDEGRTWTLRGVPAPHEPDTNRMNVAAGLARDGDLIVLASGWSNKAEGPALDPPSPDVTCRPLGPWVCRSGDGGRTWTHTEAVDLPDPDRPPIPFGNVVQCADGTLAVSLYDHLPATPDGPRSNSSLLFRSRDDGHTWGERTVIGADDFNETDLLCTEGGRMLALARRLDHQHLDLFVSDDSGETWRMDQALAGPMQIPAHLLQLKDGRLVATYGIRHRGLYGVGARISEDEGRKWYGPTLLVNCEGATDGGYPASLECDDGRILTAYYANADRGHHRYHMGVAIWDIAEQMGLNRMG